jgi:hypothetical protein
LTPEAQEKFGMITAQKAGAKCWPKRSGNRLKIGNDTRNKKLCWKGENFGGKVWRWCKPRKTHTQGADMERVGVKWQL